MKIVFEGDSITDAGRDRSNPHDMGEGYPKFTSAMMLDSFPDIEFEFVNMGISGDRTEQVVARLDQLVAEDPDMVVILIGINDVWAFYTHGIITTDAAFESNYRTILSTIKEQTRAKIVMLQPFLLNVADKENMRSALQRKQEICGALAEEFADVYVELDELLRSQSEEEPEFYAEDGVHPTADGACLIGEICLHAMAPLLKQMDMNGD